MNLAAKPLRVVACLLTVGVSIAGCGGDSTVGLPTNPTKKPGPETFKKAGSDEPLPTGSASPGQAAPNGAKQPTKPPPVQFENK